MGGELEENYHFARQQEIGRSELPLDCDLLPVFPPIIGRVCSGFSLDPVFGPASCDLSGRFKLGREVALRLDQIPGARPIAREEISKPGDYVDLRAQMDLLAVISNCPQRNNPAAGFEPTPVRAIVYAPS